jgi:hypothetical protein
MRIAIYETVHLDWVLPLCELFSMRKDEVYIFTNRAFANDLKESLQDKFSLFHWVFTDPAQSRTHFWKLLKSFFRKATFDIILLNSVDSRHLLLYRAVLQQRKAKVLINIHDIHNFFKPQYKLHWRTLARTAGKKALRTRSSAFIVNAFRMKQYIEKEKLTSKPVFWLPPVIEKLRDHDDGSSSAFTITVPGSIDEKRRDYKSVLFAVKRLHQQMPNAVRLVLAGRPVGEYGRQIIREAQDLIRQGVLVYYSEVELPESEFQELIARSTVLLSPQVSQTSIHDGIQEQYGVTKNSGNTYDAIRHGKPLIVPSHLVVPDEIQSSCISYASQHDLVDKLTQLVTNQRELDKLIAVARSNSKHFTVDKGLKKLDLILSS